MVKIIITTAIIVMIMYNNNIGSLLTIMIITYLHINDRD